VLTTAAAEVYVASVAGGNTILTDRLAESSPAKACMVHLALLYVQAMNFA
jgi:hypothetical protein